MKDMIGTVHVHDTSNLEIVKKAVRFKRLRMIFNQRDATRHGQSTVVKFEIDSDPVLKHLVATEIGGLQHLCENEGNEIK